MHYEKHFVLPVAPPFRLDLTVWTLRRRQKNRIDQWDGKRYCRVFVIQGEAVFVSVEQNTETELAVSAKSTSQTSVHKAVVELLQKMLQTEKNLDRFYQLAENDTHLRSLMREFRGVKPPRFPTVYEALMNAVACQQVSLDAGISLLNKLAETYGRRFSGKDSDQHAFPLAQDLADVSEQDLKTLGFSRQKARTAIELSKLFVEEKALFENEIRTNEEILAQLMRIKGIGRWSAEYALLRGYGRIDIFPGDDVGAQNNLKQMLKLESRPGYEEIKKLIENWHPYAGLIYFHLLLDKLRAKQLL